MSVRLRFLGAARTVTGSRHLIETDDARVLVDCGLYQEREFRDRNWDRFTVEPSSIDAVLLTHAHLDHCGLLPKLVKEGFRGPIYCTDPTADIAPVVLADSAHLQEEDAKWKIKRHRREERSVPHEIKPLYTGDDVDALIGQITPIHYGETVQVATGVQAVFHEAGHILGSSILWVNAGGKRIVFSGDLGRANRPILNDPASPPEADYIVMESTYGDRIHEAPDDLEETLAGIINETVRHGGNILIPSFAIERSQEVLYHLSRLQQAKRIPRLMVFLDSPMAIKVTTIFQRYPEICDDDMRAMLHDGASPFSFQGLKLCKTRDESMAINQIRGCAIIIAGSGMCNGGRIKHHLVHNIHRPESSVLFVGYQANGTLGRQIVEGQKEVRILGRMHEVQARVQQVHGFSGHADRDELLAWVKSTPTPPKRVFVIHGGSGVAQSFAQTLHDATGWDVHAPAYQDAVLLE